MCYIDPLASRTRRPACRPPWVPVKTSNRGVAVPRAGCVTKNAYKEYFKGFQKSRRGYWPGRNQGPCPGFREGFAESCQGIGCQVLKKQKKLNAKQDCKNCRESDRFEGLCFEGCCFQDCCEDERSQDGCENRRGQGSAKGSGKGAGCRKARCRRKAGCRRTPCRRQEAPDPASRLQDQRIRGLS